MGIYYHPKRQTFETIDAFFVRSVNGKLELVVQQDTVSDHHSVKWNGLNKVMSHVRKKFKGIPVVLAFVVPPKVWEVFKGWQWITIDSPSTERAKNQKCVRQEVWSLHSAGGKNVWPKQ